MTPGRLKDAASRSRVKHSTTEPLHSKQHARLYEPASLCNRTCYMCMQSYPVGSKCLSHWKEQLNGESSLARLRIWLYAYACLSICRLHIYIWRQSGPESLTWVRLVMACYLAPWWHSWLSDQIAYNNSESLNVTVLPHIKIQRIMTNISGGMLVREFWDCHFDSHVGYKHIMISCNSLSTSSPDDSVQSGIWYWRRCCLKKMKWPSGELMTLDISMKGVKQFWISMLPQASCQGPAKSYILFGWRCDLKKIMLSSQLSSI